MTERATGDDAVQVQAGRCERTWGIFDVVRCVRRKGHDGMCSGMTDHGRIVW